MRRELKCASKSLKFDVISIIRSTDHKLINADILENAFLSNISIIGTPCQKSLAHDDQLSSDFARTTGKSKRKGNMSITDTSKIRLNEI